MAQAKLLCGHCSSPVNIKDTMCPKCGAPVEFPWLAPIVCPACGERNAANAELCSSCGARLAVASKQEKAPRVKEKKQPNVATKQSGQKSGTRRDPWPYVALTAIIALIAIVVYAQFSKPGAAPAAPPSASMQTSSFPAKTEPTEAQLSALQTAVEANPDDQTSLLQLSNALYDAGQWGRAVGFYQKYLKLAPKDADARVDLGICFYQLGLGVDSANATAEFQKAVASMRSGFTVAPTHQAAAFNLGIVFLQMGDLDSSNAWFKRCVSLNKDSDLGAKASRMLEQHTFPQK